MNEEESQKQKSKENGLKIPGGGLNVTTLLLVALTGGGNWVATLQNRTEIDYSRDRVFRQVQDLHDGLEDFEKRQKQVLEGIEASLKNQAQILANQNKTMEADTKMLEQLHRFTQNLKNPEFHQ